MTRTPLSHQLVLAVSAVIGLSLSCFNSSIAQDGADVPPAPAVRNAGSVPSDPDFQAPQRQRPAGRLQRRGLQGEGMDGADSPLQRRILMRKKMQEAMQQGRGGMGPMGGPGMGAGMGEGGPMGGGGQLGRRQLRQFNGQGAQFGRGARGFGGGGFGGRNKLDLTPLNLTAEQKERIKGMREKTRMKARGIRQELMAKQTGLREMLFSPEATDDQIRGARKELRALQDRMDEVNLEDMLQIRGVLTPEQRQKLPMVAPDRRGGMMGGGPGMLRDRPDGGPGMFRDRRDGGGPDAPPPPVD